MNDQNSPNLLVEDNGFHRRITINRPNKANCLDEQTLASLEIAITDTSENDSIRLLEITSAGGRVFCAGADLAEAEGMTADSKHAQLFDARWDRVTTAIEILPCITVACIDGACIGGGLSIALACDLRIASAASFFSYPAVKLGFMPSPPDIRRLSALIGPSQTKSMLLLGQEKSATEAIQIGLVEKVVQGSPMTLAFPELFNNICHGQSNSQLAIKRLIGSDALEISIIQYCYQAVYDADAQSLMRLRHSLL